MIHAFVGSRAGYFFVSTVWPSFGVTCASSSRHVATGPAAGRSYLRSPHQSVWTRPVSGWLSYVLEGRPAGSMGSIVGSAVPEEPRAVHSSVESEGGLDLVSAVLTTGETS